MTHPGKKPASFHRGPKVNTTLSPFPRTGAENWTVPRQLLVRAIKARNNITALPHNTSLLDIRATMPNNRDIVEKNGLRLFPLPADFRAHLVKDGLKGKAAPKLPSVR